MANCTIKIIGVQHSGLDISIIAKADSGATHHYWREQDKSVLTNMQDLKNGLHVRLPNDEQLAITSNGTLTLHADLS